MQKVKICYICPAEPPPCQGIGCVVKTDWFIIIYLLGDISIRRVPGAFHRVPLYEARGLALLLKTVLEHFTGLK